MAVHGINDSQFVNLQANVDRDYLEREELADGTNLVQVIQAINTRLAAYNGSIPADLAEYLAPATFAISVKSRNPGAFEVNRNGEYDVARPQRGVKPYAHSLAIWSNDVAIGWTRKGLRDMELADITADIESALNGMRLQQRADIFARMLDPTEVPVDTDQVTAMVSPGFAGSGTGLNAFKGKYFPGPGLRTIPGNYSHYWACNQASLGATIRAMRDQHKKWFPNGVFHLVGSTAFINMVVALGESGGFTRAERAYIREGNDVPVAQVDPAQFVGIFDTDVFVRRPIEDFTSANGWLFQPLGALNPRNPIVPRYKKRVGKGAYLEGRDAYPLATSVILQEVGYNVNNRVGMELISVNSGAEYIVPTGFSALGAAVDLD